MSDISGTYDVLAPRWDDWSAHVVPDVRADWARKIDGYVALGERIVELGCGTGVPVGRLLSERYDYAGVDASVGMLAKARGALPDAPLTHASMHSVQYRSGSLGAVVAFYSISHTARELHAPLFAAIASWLRPGGVFVGNLNSRDDPDDFEADWLGAGPMRWSGFDGATNRELLAEAGFTVVETAVVHQIEPEGCHISPMWFVAQREA
ncbi:MAG: class I SAM-dependent methyltransferase [Actinomycetota bacterium]|nr:class I SAM-dependent methyltransferase [Actinomycetota bacterium]